MAVASSFRHGSEHCFQLSGFHAPSVSFFSALWNAAHLAWVGLAFSLFDMTIAFAAQGFGHGKEKNPPISFAGPVDALSRIFVEQLFNFPRFVVTGGWRRAFKAS